MRIKALANHTLIGLGLGRLAAWWHRNRPVILMYHGLTEDDRTLDWTQVHVADFERQLRYLKANYRVVPLPELVAMIESGTIPPYTCAITFDDGYRSCYKYALPILKQFELPASIFITSGFLKGFAGHKGFLWPDFVTVLLKSCGLQEIDLTNIGLKNYDISEPADLMKTRNHICDYFKSVKAEKKDELIAHLSEMYGERVDADRFADYHSMSVDELRTMADDPLFTIGAHSRNHQILSRLDSTQLAEEVVECKRDLEAITGKPVTCFAYPNGRFQDIGEQTWRIIRQHYTFAVTTETGLPHARQNAYLLPRVGIGRNTDFAQFRALISAIYPRPPKIIRQNNEDVLAAFLARTGRPRKIRVLQLVEDFGTVGGAEQVVHNLVNTLDPDEFASTVTLVGESASRLGFNSDTIDVHVLPLGGRVNLRTLKALITVIRKYDIDLIHSHLIRMNTYNWLASRWCRKPSIGSVHGIMTKEVSATIKLVTRLAGIFNTRTIAVSDHLKNELITVFNIRPRKLVTIHNAFTRSRIEQAPDRETIRTFREKYSCPPEVRVAVAIGHLREVKGYPYLLQATAALAQRISNVQLFIAGCDSQAEERQLRLRLESIPLGAARVVFLGEFWDIATLFEVADLYVSSSLHEGFSLTTVEAMAYGLPVVVTDSGGPSEIVRHGETGLVVPVADSQALAEAMRNVIADRELARRLGRNGQQDVYRRFSMKAFTVKHERLYRELTRKKRS